ncbi:glycosyltransferase family 4 protein, partial [Mesonia mobilis]|uniref:glycosyltransferase family 4 protein n=1 Tax=Mesonia mobilis TaxID=369791 RepID=UPI0026F3427D
HFKFVKEELASGRYGAVKTLTADFCFEADFNPEGRLFNKALGGGSLLDIGIYPIKHPNCYQKTWKYLDQLHVISNDLHQLAIKEGLPSTIPVVKITPAIDVHFFKPKELTSFQNSSSLKLISVGRLHWKKGFEETIRALNIVKKAGYDFTYTIIGEGDQYERIAYAAYEFGFLEHIRFLGKLSREEVKKEVEAAEIYIQYSIQEGFCNAVLEAQALGKLCIVSDAEGLSENVLHEQTGWVVPKIQPELLAEKIIAVSQLSAEEKNKITSRAMARVKEEFNIEKQQQAFVNFYQLPL